MNSLFLQRIQSVLSKVQESAWRLLPHTPVLMVALLVIMTGLRGLDFGYHWDEAPAQVDPVRRSLEHQVLLPGYYTYPSVNYWLNLGALAPSLLKALLTGRNIQEHLLAAIDTHTYLLRIRAIHVLVSALAVIWIYFAVLFWRKSKAEAFLAGSILGLSWEVAYHSRWAAPDSIMMQFGALYLLTMLRLHLKPAEPKLRHLSAISAGLACGTKYPGGIFLFPLLLLVYLNRGSVERRRSIGSVLLETTGIFVGTFILVTPGSVLQPWRFWEHVVEAFQWYNQRGLFGFTVEPGLDHLSRIVTYLSLVLLSRYATVSAVLAGFALVGAASVWKSSRKVGLLLVLLPLSYVLFFGLQRLMIVRNLLVLAPFMAILTARGVAATWQRLNARLPRLLLSSAITAILVVNGGWLIHAAETIRDPNSDRYVSDLASYVIAKPLDEFYVSPRVWGALQAMGAPRPPNMTISLSETVDFVAIYAYEAMTDWRNWPANIRGLIVASFGPMEVNFNYYPNWSGNDRIILMTIDQARKAGVNLGE